jgi:hypothetical protein
MTKTPRHFFSEKPSEKYIQSVLAQANSEIAKCAQPKQELSQFWWGLFWRIGSLTSLAASLFIYFRPTNMGLRHEEIDLLTSDEMADILNDLDLFHDFELLSDEEFQFEELDA